MVTKGLTCRELAGLPKYCRATQGLLCGAHGSPHDSTRAA